MNKFCNEEKNMLENYPEIRDASLRKKPSFSVIVKEYRYPISFPT